MAGLIKAASTTRGKPAVRDSNMFLYVTNGEGPGTLRWRCSKRSCSATVTTRKSTGNLVGEKLPDHSHGNKLIKQIAKDTEKIVLEKYAGVHGSIPSAVLQEISVNMLESSFPGQIASASSAGAIKMKLWRQKRVGNPHPKIPKTHTEYIETNELPDTLCKTADGADFLFYKERIGEEESVAFFTSQWGVDILNSHKTWLFDGTFSSAPVPFAQV